MSSTASPSQRARSAKSSQSRGLSTRARILGVATRLFAEHGYEACSVDAICEAAAISKGAFYHHFASKQSLFLALLEAWLAALDSAIVASRQPTVPQTMLKMLDAFQYVMATAGDRLPMFLEFWVQASRDPKIWKATIAPHRRYEDFFTDLVRQGIDEGSFGPVDPEVAGRMIVSLAMGLLLQSLLDPRGAAWNEVAHDSMTALIRSLRASSSAHV